jgi:hypothetical protein
MGTTAGTRLSARAEGRRFAWTVGCGFIVLSAIGRWRGRVHAAEVFGLVALFLLLAGALVPSRLGPVERAWKRFGEIISRVTSPFFFSLLYLLVVTPVGFLRRTLAKSPLARTRSAPTFWIRRPVVSRDDARSSLEHLF